MKRNARELVIMERRYRQDVEKHGGKADCGCARGTFRKRRPLGCPGGRNCIYCHPRDPSLQELRAMIDDAEQRAKEAISKTMGTYATALCEEHPDRVGLGRKPTDCNECAIIWESAHAVKGGIMLPWLIRDAKREIRSLEAKLADKRKRLAHLEDEFTRKKA